MKRLIIVRVKNPEDVNPAPVRPAEEFGGDEPFRSDSQALSREEILALHVARGERLVLHERVARLREENNKISDQAQRINAMNDDEFDPNLAVGLLQRIAVLDGKATVLGKRLADIGFNPDTIQTCRGIRSNAELMYSDLKKRLAGDV